MAKTKVAVLGGGVGGCVAALRLTATPQLRARYDVTVHQLGWRLGGKGASGRSADATRRIEEHGLHLWFGFYDNAFREMRAVFDELGRDDDHPLASFEDAFKGSDTIALYDREHERWRGFGFTWPENAGTPGDGAALPGFWDVIVMSAGWFAVGWAKLAAERPGLVPPPKLGGWMPWWLKPWGAGVGAGVDGFLAAIAGFAKAQTAGLTAPVPLLYTAEQALVIALRSLRRLAWATVAPYEEDDAAVRMFFTCLDTMIATVDGLVTDDVLDHPDGLESINDEDLTDWLVRHGLTTTTRGATADRRAPILRAIYDVAFAYEDGDISRPNAAAGTALNDLLRLAFTWRGHVAYKMQGGMGDVVFAPMYELLLARGVTFRFFSAVEELRLHPTQARVQEIDIVEQVAVAGGSDYDPLVDVKGVGCWPSDPLWEQLDGGAAHAAGGLDLEAQRNPLGRPVTTLVQGADFDEVVLGISVGALPGVIDDLVARVPRIATALTTACTVRTQAFQLWLAQDAASLGYPHGPGSVAGCFVEPLDTYCDMTHLVELEHWDPDEVRSVAYFCGVLDSRPESPQESRDRVRANMEQFLVDDIEGLWPAAVTAGASAHLDWTTLVDRADAAGAGRLDAQYWRANVAGSDLYVMTPAGTVAGRLPSGDTGVENLVAAGDWTKNGIDGGCVEAAAISGIDAANAIIARHLGPGEAPPAPPTHASGAWLKGP